MDKHGKETISVIMPVFNGQSTLLRTLESLFSQREHFNELTIIDDASTDDSKKIIKKFISGIDNIRFIEHAKNYGLAKTYNEAIHESKGELIISIHQDIVLLPGAMEKFIEAMNGKDVVAAGHSAVCPYDDWIKLEFWQRCFFARFVGKRISGISGQADCFRKSALYEVGLFDEKKYRTAGEDGDMVYRLRQLGKVVDSGATIIHLQSSSPDFGWHDIIFKQKQHSESKGVLLRAGRIKGIKNLAATFFREILLLSLLVPYLQFFSLALIIVYSFWYTRLVFIKNYNDPKILILPFFNIYLLLVSFFYVSRGFVRNKQIL